MWLELSSLKDLFIGNHHCDLIISFQNIGGNLYEYTLTIAKVKDEHFDMDYQLKVKNEHGTIEKTIQIQRGMSYNLLK